MMTRTIVETAGTNNAHTSQTKDKNEISRAPGPWSRSCTFQCERTLDETNYPSLNIESANKLNEDQVVTRSYREDHGKGTSTSLESCPLLVVPQIWIWQLDRIVLSSFSMTAETDLVQQTRQAYGFTDPYRPTISGLEPELQIGFMIAHYINRFGEPCELNGESISSPLDVFETTMLRVLFLVTKYVRETRPSNIKYQEEQMFLHTLSDLSAELIMIENVLSQQREILDKLLHDQPYLEHNSGRQETAVEAISQLLEKFADKCLRSSRAASGTTRNDTGHRSTTKATEAVVADEAKEAHDAQAETRKTNQKSTRVRRLEWEPVLKAWRRLQEYQARTSKLRLDVERIEKTVLDNLELKKTYASVKDAHTSVVMGAAVVGFTVITIIFAPLAFITAFFALNIDGFDRLRVKPPNTTNVTNATNSTNATSTPNATNASDAATNADLPFKGGTMAGIFGKLVSCYLHDSHSALISLSCFGSYHMDHYGGLCRLRNTSHRAR